MPAPTDDAALSLLWTEKNESNFLEQKSTYDRYTAESQMWKRKNTEKPAAHLIGIRQSSKEALHTLDWEPLKGQAFLQKEVGFLDRSLIIPKPGIYYIYCQVGFRGRGCNDAVSGPLALSSRVLQRQDSYPEPILLLAGVESVCGEQQWQGTASEKRVWYTSISLGALVQLDEKQRLYVNVSHPQHVDYRDGKTFFGVTMI
nr:PREDICTED: lymphotoxin-beta-like [Latimeria chalumnae]|eukprot:XP_014350758.1 PREDICTED: lymphotoxin-beta-like [Latimeria chalumnae]